MIACSHCGTDNTDAHVTCTSCGGSLEEAAARKLIGTVVLGIYEITDLLGQGGMSVVYKARHKMTEQEVALKILPPELAVHAALKARFVEEARALAKMDHPSIIRLYNFGEEAGRFVLAMQFVDGQTFEKMILAAGKLPWHVAVRVILEVLKALEFAHARGVIHRDIKPSNVLVRADGTATVMDFGIAKMQEASGRLTAQGQTMGTVRYMAPEQVRGDPVDARSDLYSLGAALYEAVTGDTPFDGSTHFEIMSKHLAHAPTPPRSRGAPIPEPLEAVILKALSKKPEDRWQTAREMIAALDRILKIEGSNGRITGIASSLEPAVREVTSRTRPAPRRMGLWIALAVLVIGASAGVIVFARRTQGPAPGGAPQVAWVPPLLVPGLVARVDQTFEADKVRVLSSRADVDAARVARDYVVARGKFVGWLRAGKRLEGEPVIEPVTVVVATPAEICTRELLGTVPSDCLQKPFDWRYHIESRTLYLHQPRAADDTSLALASAEQVCKDQREILVGAGCVREGGVVTTYANDARLK